MSSGSMIIWPDGSVQPPPSDSYSYHVPNSTSTYEWDEQAFSWIDDRGDYCYFEIVPMVGYGNVTYKRVGLMPIVINANNTRRRQTNIPESACDDASSDANIAKSVKVRPQPDCECGAQAVGSKRHSAWCRMYKE